MCRPCTPSRRSHTTPPGRSVAGGPVARHRTASWVTSADIIADVHQESRTIHEITEEERRRNTIVEANLGLAWAIALEGRGSRFTYNFGERLASAYWGLLIAAKNYRPERGIPFVGYAGRVIRQKIQEDVWFNRPIRLPRYLRRVVGRPQSTRLKQATADAAERVLATVSIQGAELDVPGHDQAEDHESAEDQARELLDRLMPDERELIEARMAGASHAELGRRAGITKQAMAHRVSKILAKLRRNPPARTSGLDRRPPAD